MSPAMPLLADLAQSYRLSCNERIHNRDPALFGFCLLRFEVNEDKGGVLSHTSHFFT